MGKDDAEEGRQAGGEEVRSEDWGSPHCDDPHGVIPYHSSAVHVVDQIDTGVVTSEKIMSTEFPRLKTLPEWCQAHDFKEFLELLEEDLG